jgi:eukaryotic-like serine/threonine-protein kinase
MPRDAPDEQRTRPSSDGDEFGTADPGAATITVGVEVGVLRMGVALGDELARRFKLTARLGEGGTGAVYAARDELLGEEVAVKVLHGGAGDPEALRRLRDEVRAARRIAHANVCRVHDLCVDGGLVFVVMELLRGETLRKRLRRGLPPGEVLDIVRQVGAGLAAAHRAGIVHCDVKPENVLLVAGERAVLTDFGIARLAHTPAAGAAAVEGTPAYMSPEQLDGAALDERADVFALATVAFEALVGRHPVGLGGSFWDFSRRLVEIRPEVASDELTTLAPEARTLVVAALLKGMAKDPAARHDGVDALVADLVAGFRLGVRSEAAPPPPASEGATSDRARSSKPSRPTANRGSRRIATVVQVIVEPTGSELDEEIAAERAEAILGAAQQTLTDAGGLLVSRAPTALVAVFGAVSSAGDEPLRAVATARALAQIGGRDVSLRAGVDTGRLLVKSGRAAALSVSGDPLARAAALAAGARAGAVLVSPRIARLVGRRFRLVAEGEAFVVAERRGAAPVETPLVGRDAELAGLVDRLGGVVRSGRTRGAVVLGAPGIGKSRLLGEVADVLDATGAFTAVSATALPDDLVTPHAVLRALVVSLLSLGERPSLEDAVAAARAVAGDGLAPELGAAMARLAVGEGTASDVTAARAFLVAVARQRPLLLVVDDAHLADDASLDLVEALGRGELEASIALLVSGRSELLARRPKLGEATVLGPLSAEAARELADPDATRAPWVDAVVEAAEGNPLFALELAREARERGGLVGAISPTVEAAIQARLDRVSGDARDVLRGAAVLGRSFRLGELIEILRSASEIPVEQVDEALDELEDRGLLVPLPPDAAADDRVRFAHALVHDVAYRELTPATRRALHAAAAYLDDPADDRVTRLAERARHLDGADDRSGALAAYLRAGELAAGQGAHADAYRCYGRARTLAGDDPDDALLVGFGTSALASGHFAEAEEALDRAVARAGGTLLARALLSRAMLDKQRARWDEAVAAMQRGLLVVGDDLVLEAALHGQLGWVYGYILGDNARGLAESSRAVEMLEGTAHLAELAHALGSLGATHMRGGRWREQLRCNRRNLELGEQLGSLELRARAHLNLSVNLGAIGETDESIHHASQAILLYERLCAPSSVALARNNRAFALIDRGRLDEAAEELDEAFRISDLSGGLYFIFESELLRGRIAARRGDLDEAFRRAEAAIARAQENGGRVDEGVSWKYLGAFRSLAGDHDGAEAAFARAEALLATADRSEALRVLVERGRAAMRRGDGITARALWSQSRPELETLPAQLDLAHLEDTTWI